MSGLLDLPARVRCNGTQITWAAPDEEDALRARVEVCFASENGFFAISDAAIKIGARSWYVSIPHALSCGECLAFSIPKSYPIDWQQFSDHHIRTTGLFNISTPQKCQTVLDNEFPEVLQRLYHIAHYFAKHLVYQIRSAAKPMRVKKQICNTGSVDYCMPCWFYYVSQDGYLVFSLLLLNDKHEYMFPKSILRRIYQFVRPVSNAETFLIGKTDPGVKSHLDFLLFSNYWRSSKLQLHEFKSRK